MPLNIYQILSNCYLNSFLTATGTVLYIRLSIEIALRNKGRTEFFLPDSHTRKPPYIEGYYTLGGMQRQAGPFPGKVVALAGLRHTPKALMIWQCFLR